MGAQQEERERHHRGGGRPRGGGSGCGGPAPAQHSEEETAAFQEGRQRRREEAVSRGPGDNGRVGSLLVSLLLAEPGPAANPARGRETRRPGVPQRRNVTPGTLVHVEDDISKRRFLCDTGASNSIFPHHSTAAPTGPALHGPAGRPIKCWGEKELTLSFNKKQYK